MAELKLKKTPGREGQYWLELPDKREIVVGKIQVEVNNINVRRSMVWMRLETRWAWEVHDFVAQQVAGREGYKTRKDALEAAQTYARTTIAGVAQPETE